MTLEPLLRAPLIVQAHVATVVPAFLLGAWLLVFSRRGLPWHRALGALVINGLNNVFLLPGITHDVFFGR